MAHLVEFLMIHWLVVLLSATAAFFLVHGGRRLARRSFEPKLLLIPAACFLLLAGHFLIAAVWKGASSNSLALLIVGVGTAILLVDLAVLFTSHGWSRTAALVAFAISAVGLGALVIRPLQAGVLEVARAVPTVQFVQPAWLWLLVLPAAVLGLSRKSLAGLGPVRRPLVIGARCLVVTVLVLALAEPRLRRPSDQLAVIYVVDRSVSIPQDLDPATLDSPTGAVDRRWQRLQSAINEAAARRGADHRDDLSGVILFARRPKLVLPARAVDRLVINPEIFRGVDDTYTDIAAALKLAMASFPESVRKRIVLISDGNENLGNAEQQAELARKNGIQIDTIPLATGQRHENEVMVQAVEAPSRAEKGARLPIRVFVRNAHPTRVVPGLLELIQNRNGVERPLPIQGGPGVVDGRKSPARVDLQPGINVFTFRDKADADDKKEEEFSFSYRALFQPLQPIPGDRVQNNRALAHVIAKDQRRVLFLESEGTVPGRFTHQHLIDRLLAAKFEVHPLNVAKLPKERDDILHLLGNYGCVVIANIPAEMLTREQQEAIRNNTRDQGCGLVVVGGPESYGAGGYQNTPIEKALPVDCSIKAMSAAGKGGLVLIMHASEMADGNKWQKEIAKLAIQRLAPVDMVGVLYYDLNTKWHVPFQTVGGDRGRLMGMVDRMAPGDMPDFDPFLKSAFDTLANPDHGLATRHVILISDGDPSLGGIGQQALQDMKRTGVTCSTVGVATHGAPESQRLEGMAIGRPGEKPPFYNVTNPAKLPAIYVKESRRVSQSYLFEKKFTPKLIVRDGPTEGLPDHLPDLHGFIRTTLKPSPLAQMLVEGPNTFDQRFPVLATWQYGLGRAAAFTSDARSKPPGALYWDRDWAASDVYLKFWEQTIAWALRGSESDRLIVTTEQREGKVHVVVEARDENNRPITDLIVEAKVSVPGTAEEEPRPIDLQFSQRQGGSYEAEFRAEDVGSYIINVAARQTLPGYNGRFRNGLPKTVAAKGAKLYLADGTEVRRLPDGSLVHADDGKPVAEGQYERYDRQRSAVTVSYSPEYADLESNTALLRSISRITGGKVFSEDDGELQRLARAGEFYRAAAETTRGLLPLWYWLVFLAGLGLLLDVAVRRIAIEPGEVRQMASRLWGRLRQRRQAETVGPDFLDRLRQRKEASDEELERERAARRFEGTSALPEGTPPGAEEKPVSPPPVKPASSEKPPEAPREDDDFFAKLRRAKKRAPHERGESDTDQP